MSNPADELDHGTLRPDRTGQAEAFDAIGERYDEAFPHKEGQVAAAEWLIGSLPAGSRALDLGCGTGLPTAGQLAAAGVEVVGVDLSDGMVTWPAPTGPAGCSTRRTSPICGPAGRWTSAASTR